jgi:uncharacterized membrane protein SirB2
MSDAAIQGIKHTHMLVVFIFVIVFLFKAALLFLGKKELLAKVRKATMVPIDMLMPLIFIITGILLTVQIGIGNMGGWFHLKLTLVLIVTPVAIIGMKKENKVLVGIASLTFVYLLILALTKSITFS